MKPRLSESTMTKFKSTVIGVRYIDNGKDAISDFLSARLRSAYKHRRQSAVSSLTLARSWSAITSMKHLRLESCITALCLRTNKGVIALVLFSRRVFRGCNLLSARCPISSARYRPASSILDLDGGIRILDQHEWSSQSGRSGKACLYW